MSDDPEIEMLRTDLDNLRGQLDELSSKQGNDETNVHISNVIGGAGIDVIRCGEEMIVSAKTDEIPDGEYRYQVLAWTRTAAEETAGSSFHWMPDWVRFHE